MDGQDQKTMYSNGYSLYTIIVKEFKFQSFKYWLDKVKVLLSHSYTVKYN